MGVLLVFFAKYDKAIIWNTQTGVVVGEIPLGANAIKRGQAFISAAFSADGPSLLTGNSDRSLQLWDANNLTELARWTVPECDPWKPTGKAIATVSFGKENNPYFTIASNDFVHKPRLKTHLALRSNDRHKKTPLHAGGFLPMIRRCRLHQSHHSCLFFRSRLSFSDLNSDQLHFKNQRGIRTDWTTAGTAWAIGQIRRNKQLPLGACRH